jgi:hypothetical protein
MNVRGISWLAEWLLASQEGVRAYVELDKRNHEHGVGKDMEVTVTYFKLLSLHLSAEIEENLSHDNL